MAATHDRLREDLFDVDDGPLLRKRQMVMSVCVAQICISVALGLLQLARRRGAILLILNPFFISAGVLGYLGAKRCQPVLVMAHFTGSAGLSLLFAFFILAEAFLKRDGTDVFIFAINFPMDLFLLSTAGFSVSLWLSLVKYRRALKDHREQMRAHFAQLEAGERGVAPSAGADAAYRPGLGAAVHAAAIEARVAGELPPLGGGGGGGDADGAVQSHGLRDDLRCPISLEVMRDPVICADGHSYERDSIERWLAAHRTSPMTGRVLPHRELVPNHRLRAVIEELHGTPGLL